MRILNSLLKASTQALMRVFRWSLPEPELAAKEAGVSTTKPETFPTSHIQELNASREVHAKRK